MDGREGFNLFSKYGRQHFQGKKLKHIPWKYVFIDTVLPQVCKLIGHRPVYVKRDDFTYCRRCELYLHEGKSVK